MSASLSCGTRPSQKWEGRKPDLRAAIGYALLAMALGVSAKAAYIPTKAVVAQAMLERAFTQSLATGQPVKAWGWADTWPVARLEIGRIGAQAIVLKGASGEALAFGPSLLDETSRIGERGTAVIAALMLQALTAMRRVFIWCSQLAIPSMRCCMANSGISWRPSW